MVASDGFLTAVDESDADFTIPGKAPRVAILAPTGTKPIVGAQAAVLRGAARDVEDGRLADSALRWSSDLNGNLGTGGTVILEGTVLVPGTHVLTLTATDSDALTGTATVPLIVVRQGPICGDGTVDPGEACDDGNILGDDECSADCLTSTGPTTTVVGSGSTTTTLPPSSCAAGCEDGDPCTENGCVAGVGCVSAARTRARGRVVPLRAAAADGMWRRRDAEGAVPSRRSGVRHAREARDRHRQDGEEARATRYRTAQEGRERRHQAREAEAPARVRRRMAGPARRSQPATRHAIGKGHSAQRGFRLATNACIPSAASSDANSSAIFAAVQRKPSSIVMPGMRRTSCFASRIAFGPP